MAFVAQKLGLIGCFLVSTLITSVAFSSEKYEIKNGSDDPMPVVKYGAGPVAVILAYQYKGTMRDWKFFAEELEAAGFSAYTFDFNGYGSKGGWKKERAKNHLDVVEIAKFAREQGAEKLFLIGSSMGAGAVLKAAEILDTNGVIAMAPYVDRGNKFASPSSATAKAIEEKVLLVSAKGDTSASHAKKLDKLIPNSSLAMYEGKAHGMAILKTSDGKDLRSKVFAFLQ